MSDETSPSANAEYDLIVVGTGGAGNGVAFACRRAGWSVVMVDSRPFGGTCSQRGCDPKRVLSGAAELVDWGRRMRGQGVSAPALSVAWPDLMRFKRGFTDPIPANTERDLAEAGITMAHGRARFVDRTAVRVGERLLRARYIVIATGARRATLGIAGEDLLTSSTQFMELDALPRRIVLVGGGYIAFEFAHIAARAGAQVAILHRGQHPLRGFDPDLVDQLVRATTGLGVDMRAGAAVEVVEQRAGALVVRASMDGAPFVVEADLAIHAAGRVPEIDDMDLEAAGVAYEPKGVTVNQYLQSVSNPAVYAAGDAVASGDLPLTPVADLQSDIVARNMLEGNQNIPDYRGVPSVVFTIPPLARVGLDETAARARGLRFSTLQGDTSGWYSARRVNMPYGGFKVLVEEGSGRILGAHVLGLQAEEVINIFGLAIRHDLRAADLKAMPYAYPSCGHDIQEML